MWGSRTSNRARAEAEAALPVEDEAVETPLVPCNNLRAHWEIGADGKLAMRWDLVEPVRQLRLRVPQAHDPSRRTA
jgi:hypothetical protein